MQIRIWLSIFLLSFNVIAFSQSAPPSYLGNYVEPSPNVASLGKYADYPVAYYTGVPNINVPITDFKDGSLSSAIFLSYHSSGIRVSENASWVGLGWALNAGGVIHRTVRGCPDEGGYYDYNPSILRGYYSNWGLSELPLMGNPIIVPPISNGQEIGYLTKSTGGEYPTVSISNGIYDTESDLYSFNFNGHTGKFVFDENRTPHLLSDDNLKISVSYEANTGGGGGVFKYWIITDAGGVQYFFGENNKYERTITELNRLGDTEPWGGLNLNWQLPSSWCLTRIYNPNTKETISYNYTSEGYTYLNMPHSNFLYTNDVFNTMQFACAGVDNQYSSLNAALIFTAITGQRLTSIVSKNFTAQFVAINEREDLMPNLVVGSALPSLGINPHTYRLDAIKLFDNNTNQCIKQFNLGYDYFVSSSATRFDYSLTNFVEDTKRLKLISVTELSGDGTIQKSPYNFTYFEEKKLPRRLSFDQDHWGFSNYEQGNKNRFFLPPITYSNCSTPSQNDHADRAPKWPDMQAFVLTKIKDPLGAITDFEYEANTTVTANSTQMVGGLRIKKIKVTDYTGAANGYEAIHIRKFDYGSGGVLYNQPKYIFKVNNEYLVSSPYTCGFNGYSSSSMDVAVVSSGSVVPLQDINGDHIGYPTIKEIFGENGENGSIEYTYTTTPSFSENDSRLHVNNFTSAGGACGGIFPNGLFSTILPANLNYYTGIDVNAYYPFAPKQIALNRGQLVNKKIYDATGNLLKKIENTYQTVFNENYWMRGLRAFDFKFYYGDPSIPTTTSVFNQSALTYYKLHCGLLHLVSSTETNYANGDAPLISTLNYQFESSSHTLPTGTTLNTSSGDLLTKKTFYSFDYADNATSDNVFAKMKQKNLLLPVASRTWKNNTLIEGAITKYQDFSTSINDQLIYPAAIHVLETAMPLSISQAGEGITLSGQINTLIPSTFYKEKVNYNFDGGTGKIIEQKLVNDKTNALLWDDQYSRVLAEVENASASEIAFTSFELGSNGNWNYQQNGIITDPLSLSGKKHYSLSLDADGIINSTITLNTNKHYVISYWSKSGQFAVSGTQSSKHDFNVDGWIYYEHEISGVTTATISGAGFIDEVRLYPKGSQMKTYTYDSFLGMTSCSDVNNRMSYYEYDILNRLSLIRNQNKKITQKFNYLYNASGNPDPSSVPSWTPTGNTLCLTCALNSNYNSGIGKREESDLNPNSPTYNQLRWVISTTVSCPSPAVWQNTNTQPICAQANFGNPPFLANTGEQLQQQIDINPCSNTYNQTQMVSIGINTNACPLPSCTTTNCTGEGWKCINNHCEQGRKIFTTSAYSSQLSQYVCIYYYRWSDGSVSSSYSVLQSTPCH